MAKINVQLLDGAITEVIEDSFETEGCPTCDFGKAYVSEIKFKIEVNYMDCPLEVTLLGRGEKGYSKSLSLANIITLMSYIIENEVSYEGFLYLCRTKLNKDGDVSIYTTEL